MSLMNYDRICRWLGQSHPQPATTHYRVHKSSTRYDPAVSIVLLDWSCRESLHALDWLQRQSVPRDRYELLWIDLYDRVPEEALQKADAVITLGQTGLYHKHVGYNVGLLEAHGILATICDSDAVFPEDFIESLLTSFQISPDPAVKNGPPVSQVLMHYELRTPLTYPARLDRASDLKENRWQWRDLHPNVGACMTVRRDDAIRFGGFDEDASYRGYLCGPYDLGWRLVNAGLPEYWHDPSVVLWHFAHPDPVGSSGVRPSLRTRLETVAPHVDLHALTAVEHFATGQILPRRENPTLRQRRLAARQIGTAYEARYAQMPMTRPLTRWQRCRLTMEMTGSVMSTWSLEFLGRVGRGLLGAAGWQSFKSRFRRLPAAHDTLTASTSEPAQAAR